MLLLHHKAMIACIHIVLSIWLARSVPAVAMQVNNLEADIGKLPSTPDWSQYCPRIPDLGRRLRLASPCVGIHGSGYAMKALGIPTDSTHIYDLEAGYAGCLTEHLLSMGMDPVHISLHLGQSFGDVLKVALSYLRAPIDFLISGPPCPPWAGQGIHGSLRDPKAKVFLRIIQWVVFFAKSCGLVGVVLENVIGIKQCIGGLEPTINHFLRVLRKFVPEFDWVVDTLKLVDYACAQSRVRVLLRGMRTCIVKHVPQCMPSFGVRSLKDTLGGFPNTLRSTLSSNHRDNLESMETTIRNMVKAGRLRHEDIVVISLDRASNKEYKQPLSINVAPTLTTHNAYLFVLSVGDVVLGTPDASRTFFRFIQPIERLPLQGFPTTLVKTLPAELIVKACGNAYPPPVILAAVAPMIMAFAFSGVDTANWPPIELLSQGMPDEVQKAMVAMRRPLRVADKKKHAAWKAKHAPAKKRKNRHRSDSE